MNQHSEYQFGEFLVEPLQNQVSTSAGPRSLEPRTMDVLVYLIENRDRVVSSDELLEKLWPDRIVEESTIHRRINQLRKALDDSAANSKYIKTFVKRGYQAIAEVSIPTSDEATPAGKISIGTRNHSVIIVLGIVAISFFVGLAYFLQPRESEVQSQPPYSNPSIAVLPFTNMSEFTENEFFAAGVHEDLLTRLSGISGLGVISRTSVMRYAEHEQSVQEIGEELNVNYIVEGSVQRQNQQVRITVQLIDAQSNRHVWAMTYDRDLSDTFTVQSEITREVAAQLTLELLNEEVDIYDTYIHDVLFKSRKLMRERTSDSLTSALDSLRLARTANPESAEVHAAIGETLYLQSRANKSWQDVSEESQRSLELALELDPDLISARLALARVQVWWLRDIPAADLNYQAVIKAAPNNTDALMKYGEFLANTRAMRDVGMPHLRRAVVLNPYSGEAWSMLASNLMRSGNFEESYEVLMSGFDRVPDDYYLLRYQMEYFLFSGDRVQTLKLTLDLIRRDPSSLSNIAILANSLRRLEFYAEAQLWLDEMFLINPEHSDTYLSEVNQLRYQKDWQGLAQINSRWEPHLHDYVMAPRRNWELWSMQAEADQLWQDGETDQARVIYGNVASFLLEARISGRMGVTVQVIGNQLLELGIMLSRALTRIDRIAEANDVLQKITRNKGTGGAFEIERIQALAMLSRTDEAIEALQRLLTVAGSDEPKADGYALGSTELGMRTIMDENTDWLNGINRDPAITHLYQEILTRQAATKSRVQSEIPELFNPSAFLQSARLLL